MKNLEKAQKNGKTDVSPGTLAARKAWETRRANPKKDDLPPHSWDAEAGALSCVLQAGDAGSQQNVDAMLYQLRPNFLYDHRHRTLHHELCQMRMSNKAIDMVMAFSWLKSQKREGELYTKLEECGGLDYLQKLIALAPSPALFDNYLPTLKEFALRRWCLAKTARLNELAKATDLTADQLREEFGEIYEQSSHIGVTNAPMIHVLSPAQARAFEPDPADFMVGEGLITRGMFVTIGGEPGVGKSRLATTLAVAGARGNNRWLNYPIRCKWRTLILQSENDAIRLKEDFQAVPEQFNDDIRVSDALSHGIAFDHSEFRRELRRIYEDWPFQMLIIDPWNDVSFEEGQKDYKQALLNIASVFRGGLQMPCVVIVAHLRKRGRDESQRRKSGRELLHELSGSLALGSSSRTVLVVQHVDTSMDDPRIVVELAKANNCHPDWLKEFGVRSAWNRANGAFESVDIDWQEFDNPGDPERRKVTEEMIVQVFDGEKELKPASISKKLKTIFQVGESTAYRAIGEDGYLRNMLARTATGKLKLNSARA
jgi:AAA domain/DnaB-like helicase N terminal domain